MAYTETPVRQYIDSDMGGSSRILNLPDASVNGHAPNFKQLQEWGLGRPVPTSANDTIVTNGDLVRLTPSVDGSERKAILTYDVNIDINVISFYANPERYISEDGLNGVAGSTCKLLCQDGSLISGMYWDGTLVGGERLYTVFYDLPFILTRYAAFPTLWFMNGSECYRRTPLWQTVVFNNGNAHYNAGAQHKYRIDQFNWVTFTGQIATATNSLGTTTLYNIQPIYAPTNLFQAPIAAYDVGDNYIEGCYVQIDPVDRTVRVRGDLTVVSYVSLDGISYKAGL